MKKNLFVGLLATITISVISCGKSHPQYVYLPESLGWKGVPIKWEVAVQGQREYWMQFGLSYDEANKKAEETVATYKSADN